MNIKHPLHTHKHTRNDQNVTDRWTYGRKDGHTNGRANSTSTTNIVCRGGITRLSTITVENRKKDENRKKRQKSQQGQKSEFSTALCTTRFSKVQNSVNDPNENENKANRYKMELWGDFTAATRQLVAVITNTYLYNFDPLQPHFYLVKLGFTGVYIIFLISAQNIDIPRNHNKLIGSKENKKKINITKTCHYNFDSLKPHFYIVKLGFTGVYIVFLISAQKHRLWVLVRTTSPSRFQRVSTNYVLSRNIKNIRILSENFQFLMVKISIYLNRCVFVMICTVTKCGETLSPYQHMHRYGIWPSNQQLSQQGLQNRQ